MADKEVKVKIIADISKFEKAIEQLQDTLDGLTKSFKDFANQNFNKIEKSFDGANDKAQDLQKTISNLGKEIEDVAKADIDNLEESFDSAKKSVDKVTEGVDEFKDTMQSADKVVEGLADGLNSIKTNTFDNLSSDVNEFKEDIQTADKEVEQLKDNLNSMKTNSFDTINREMNEFKENVQTADREVEQLKDSLNATDTNVFDKLTRSGNNLKELFSNLSKKLKLDSVIEGVNNLKSKFSKLGESLDLNSIKTKLSDMKEGLLEIGSTLLTKVANKFSSIYDGGKEGNTIFSKMKNIISGIWEGMGKFGSEIKATFSGGGLSNIAGTFADIFTAMKLGTRSLQDISAELNQANRAVSNLEGSFDDLERKIKNAVEDCTELKGLIEGMEYDEDFGSTYDELCDELKRAEKNLKRLSEEQERVNEELKQAEERAKSLQDEFDNFGNVSNKFQGITEAVSKIKDAFGQLKSGDIGGAFATIKELASTGVGKIAIIGTAIMAVVTALNKLYQAGKQRFFEGLENVQQIFQPLVNFAKSVGTEIKTAFENIGGMQLDLSSAIETAVTFESTIAQVGAICGASGKDLQQLSDVARKWGATTRYSGNEVAEAMTYMGMAGWSSKEIMDGLGGVLNLATVGCIDLGQASDFVTKNHWSPIQKCIA